MSNCVKLKNVLLKLLQHGDRIEAKDSRGWTPLFYAVNMDQSSIVKILLDYGADVNVT